ncbi:MAG: protein-L-isoaspartate(D-aspartate) O-methyltransferase [Planctomycetaceae bacterium]|nr:protein-L-isoaspartate(D-aspartate) O-methyltransferase [Planctomycetaceae bacterium]
MDAVLTRCITAIAAASLLLTGSQVLGQSRDTYRPLRLQMVEQDLASEGINNPRVLESMQTVPRHLFVRPGLREQAYFDQALDIGFKQTISPPFIVAYMTQVLDPQPEDRVLEIGTGSGYQAAVLSGLVKEVYTIEIVPELGKKAEKLLKQLSYPNVHVRVGDGYQGWTEHAPFDKIIVTCSPESVPQPLVDQLKEGGRMIIPLGERYQQVFHLLVKQDGELQETELLPTLFVPMTGQSEDERAVKPDAAHPQIANGSFEELRDDGLAVGWHYQRRTTVEEGTAPDGTHWMQFENTNRGRTSHILQGLAIDGRAVSAVDISLQIKVGDIRQGESDSEVPMLVIHWFDQKRQPIGQKSIGPWLAESENWQRISERVIVPEHTREAIVMVGLNGATGTLGIDNVRLKPEAR